MIPVRPDRRGPVRAASGIVLRESVGGPGAASSLTRRLDVPIERTFRERIQTVAHRIRRRPARRFDIATTSAASPQQPPLQHRSVCESHRALGADPYDSIGDGYVGHDEPSVLFKSSVPGSGNDITYELTLPLEPKQKPENDGSGGTWDFQLRPTFWFGLTLCDSESAPEFTKTCIRDSDANDLVGARPTKPDFIGHHPGNAYMELQVLRTGLRPAVRGLRLQRDPVLRRHDHRQPHPRPGRPTRATTRTATTTSSAASSRSTGPTSPAAASRRLRPTRCSPGPSPTPTSVR